MHAESPESGPLECKAAWYAFLVDAALTPFSFDAELPFVPVMCFKACSGPSAVTFRLLLLLSMTHSVSRVPFVFMRVLAYEYALFRLHE